MSSTSDGTSRPGSLDKYLTELEKAERTGVLLSLMQYPKTASLVDGKPVVTAYYTCDESSRCSFELAKKLIKESVDLKAYGSTEVASILLEEIESHPSEFLPHKMDGFQLYRGGFDILWLQRQDGKHTVKDGRTGFVEYNELRARALEASSRARKDVLEQAVVRIVDAASTKSSWGAGSGCSIM